MMLNNFSAFINTFNFESLFLQNQQERLNIIYLIIRIQMK